MLIVSFFLYCIIRQQCRSTTLKTHFMKTEEQRLLDELYDRESRGNWIESSVEHSKTKLEDYPDAKKHQIVSFIKSGIRILGYMLIPFDLLWAAGILVISELVGIVEELV